jgi:hypothetical protein
MRAKRMILLASVATIGVGGAAWFAFRPGLPTLMPTVKVFPAAGKAFAAFQEDDAMCRGSAQRCSAEVAQRGNN